MSWIANEIKWRGSRYWKHLCRWDYWLVLFQSDLCIRKTLQIQMFNGFHNRSTPATSLQPPVFGTSRHLFLTSQIFHPGLKRWNKNNKQYHHSILDLTENPVLHEWPWHPWPVSRAICFVVKTWSNCTDGHGDSMADPLEVPRDCGTPVLQRELGTGRTSFRGLGQGLGQGL